MWISQIELKDIKSYGPPTTVELAQGVNAICGQNGAGKSTILEAIGLALFGQSSYKNQEQLVNLRAKRGEISITIVDGRDDRPYQVVRPIKGGSPYVYDPETKHQVASGVQDVQQWLRDCMGVEPTTDLQALFENAIGVPQGMLTTSFLLTEANRRKVFDPLLGVEDYKRVWDNMLAVANTVKGQRGENEKEQERRRGRLEEFPQLQAEAKDLEETIQDKAAQQEQVSDHLAELANKLALLEQQQKNVDQLEGRLQPLDERRGGLEAQLRAAESALAEARQAQQTVEQCAADYQAYEQAAQERGLLEEKRKAREEIQSRLGKCRQALALARQALAELAKQLADVAEAEARLVELAPLVEKQEALEQAQKDAEEAAAALRTAQERINEEEKRLENLQNELADVQGQVEQRKEKAQKIQQCQERSDELRAKAAALDQELNGLENQLEEVRQALQATQGRLNEYQNLQKQIETTEKNVEQRQEQLTVTEAEVAQRSELEQALETLDESRQRRRAELATLEGQIGEQEAARQQAQALSGQWQAKVQTLDNLRGNLETAENRLATAETGLSSLEAELEERHKLAEQIQSWEAEQAAANERRDSINGDLSSNKTRLSTLAEAMSAIEVEAETPCPVCRKPLHEHDITDLKTHYEAEQKNIQTGLKEAEANLKQTNKTLDQLARQIKQARQTQEKLATEAQRVQQAEVVSSYRSEVTDLQQQMAELSNAPQQVEQFETQLAEIKKTLTDLKAKQAGLRQAEETDQAEQTRLQGEISQLARQADQLRLQAEIAQLKTDLSQWLAEIKALSDAPAQVEALETRHQTLDQNKAKLQEERQQVNDSREGLGKEIGKLQTEMSHLASPDRVAELKTALEEQNQAFVQWRNKVTELSQAPAQLEAAKKALAELDDPRRKQQAAQDEANKRPQLEAEQLEKQAEFEQEQAEKIEIEAELQPFADLDQRFERVDAILKKTRAAHQTYLEQRATAETLPQRETQFEEAEKNVETVKKEQADLQGRLAQAREAYDPDQHQLLREAHEETLIRQTQLETQLDGDRKQLDQRQEKIADLEAVAAELEDLRQEGERLEELQTVVEFIRRTIRDAGPEVTKLLAQLISNQADQIFADIMNDHQQELTWDETYAILVRRDGYERDFQQLSGGEAMTAALAVRLALLQSMSAVDVAFFDEPTANLDPERRASLAEQIARVRGFSQLVVISHDDTFEQDIGHVIHIARDEQGYSQVVG